ncbi:hypothetical protein OOU_Y34scaffold00173g1 [Pyricularia oryzae Y34]|uniref:Uncharacterized protein n=1 Tax=Pyricularia oryzae (strain Y34) TaxID=1143189 RepID=A0AA97PQE3_PYRO3|nr:hypothetical protein OOU_Y34scaffold00173g1 [Pyricularia oryzae Y34]
MSQGVDCFIPLIMTLNLTIFNQAFASTVC